MKHAAIAMAAILASIQIATADLASANGAGIRPAPAPTAPVGDLAPQAPRPFTCLCLVLG